MMINSSEIHHIVDLITNSYFFLGNEKEWQTVSDLLNSQESISILDFDRILGKMGDVHLRIYEKNFNPIIRICSFYQDETTLYLVRNNECERVLKLGNYSFDDLILLYKNYYKGYPLPAIISRIANDYQMINNPFEHSDFLETVNGIIKIKKIPVESCKKIINVEKNSARENKLISKLDADTLLIRLLSFNHLELMHQFIEQLESINTFEYKSLIFDVRNNQGGSVQIVSKLMEYILPFSVEYFYTIKNTKGYEEKRIIVGKNRLRLSEKKINSIYVFANENTASVAEYIFIEGLLEAFGSKVKIIGRKTQGTSGQAAVIKIRDNVYLNMTIKRLFDNDGNELKQGFLPDYPVEETLSNISEDAYIRKYYEIKTRIQYDYLREINP